MSLRLTGKARYDDFRLEWVQARPSSSRRACSIPKFPAPVSSWPHLSLQLVAHRDAEVLDMGTGSGVCAVIAARHARRVVAVDINAAAVRCARINALLNHVEQKIEVRHGDLFAPCAGERFDLILFNPPFLRGPPRDDRDRAWRSTDVAERFAAGLGDISSRGLCAGSAVHASATRTSFSTSFAGSTRRFRAAQTPLRE